MNTRLKLLAQGWSPATIFGTSQGRGPNPERGSSVYLCLALASCRPIINTVTDKEQTWREFEAMAKRPLSQRIEYGFIRTYKPVLDDEPYRSFESMEEYRQWCEANVPRWLGYGRV